MVSYEATKSSNSRIATSLPSGLVAVFVGATNGIGEAALRAFAKHAKSPRVYFVGRSQEAGDRIANDCRTVNPSGQFTFMQADTSLIRNVDKICQDIKAKESTINILFLSTGTLVFGTQTEEGLHLALALAHYGRIRFIQQLLPLLEKATSLRRVVSCFTGTKEGEVDETDFQRLKGSMNFIKERGRGSTLHTLSLETLARQAPTVSFIHDFPGPVKSGIARGTTGVMWFFTAIFGLLGPFVNIPVEESGERHLWFATSGRWPAAKDAESSSGVSLVDGVEVARGIDGKVGSGMYSIDENGESAGARVEELLANYRKEGMVEKIWEHTTGEFKRIEAMQKA